MAKLLKSYVIDTHFYEADGHNSNHFSHSNNNSNNDNSYIQQMEMLRNSVVLIFNAEYWNWTIVTSWIGRSIFEWHATMGRRERTESEFHFYYWQLTGSSQELFGPSSANSVSSFIRPLKCWLCQAILCLPCYFNIFSIQLSLLWTNNPAILPSFINQIAY